MGFSKLSCVALALMIFLATEASSLKTVSFKFNKFTSIEESDIIFQGDAKKTHEKVITLTTTTSDGESTGRALFTKPVPIWDKKTGNIANFFATFTFVVSDVNGKRPGDGLIFFLAPPDTKIPKQSTGGNLGVVDGSTSYNQFVGIEFDSFVNDWDPSHAHVGINVGSMMSLATVKWNRESGSVVGVSIVYASQSKTLSVVVSKEDGTPLSTITQVIDFKAVLPEVVWVGLSATSTSSSRERHDITSIDFSTTSSDNNNQINLATYARYVINK